MIEVIGHDAGGLRLRIADRGGAPVVHVPWKRLTDRETGRLQLGCGHCVTFDSVWHHVGRAYQRHAARLGRASPGSKRTWPRAACVAPLGEG